MSAVTGAETLGGMRSGERHQVRRLLDSFHCLPSLSTLALGIGPVDYLVAATAEIADCELATLNVKHFPMFADLTAPITPRAD